MGEEVPEWATMWGAKVKMPVDMPDDMLKDALETCSRVIDQYPDFENDGKQVEVEVDGAAAAASATLRRRSPPRLHQSPIISLPTIAVQA